MPTMPCRREVHAGIHEYLWRGWGPLEPFDVTLAQMCQEKEQVAMLLTDTQSIRDVLFFPMLKPEAAQAPATEEPSEDESQ